MDLISEQRAARRAFILETARQMISERGYEAVTVRDLAQRCRVSVPTLYNQFGGKDQLLATAIEAYFHLGHGGIDKLTPGSDRLLALIDQCAEQLLAAPEYHRRLLEAFSSMPSTEAVKVNVAAALIEQIVVQLDEMQRGRQLAAWVQTHALAVQLTSTCIGTAIQWSAGYISDERLLDGMRYTMGLVLLGVARGQTSGRIEQLVRAAQNHIDSETENDNERHTGGS